VREQELLSSDISRTFDVEHLKSIHKYLFQDVYDWAGEFRTIDIYKGYTAFTPAVNLDREAQELFDEIGYNNFLCGLGKDEFAHMMTNVMSDLNQLHPFREGNGRTQRVFAQQLAERAGYDLHLRDIPKSSLQSAMTISRTSSNPLERLIRANCEVIDPPSVYNKKNIGVLSSIKSLFRREEREKTDVSALGFSDGTELMSNDFDKY
jgi:cell filamentation protein